MRPSFILSIVLLTAALKTFAQHEVPIDGDFYGTFDVNRQEKRDSIERLSWKTSEFIWEVRVLSLETVCDTAAPQNAYMSHILLVLQSVKGKVVRDTVEFISDISNIFSCRENYRKSEINSAFYQAGPRLFQNKSCIVFANSLSDIEHIPTSERPVFYAPNSIRTGYYGYKKGGNIYGFGKSFKSGKELTTYLREKNLIDETTEVFPNKNEKVPPKKEEKTREELLEEIRLKSEETYWSERNQEALRRGDSLIERGKQRYEELQKKKARQLPD